MPTTEIHGEARNPEDRNPDRVAESHGYDGAGRLEPAAEVGALDERDGGGGNV
ncbi:MAG: hypothetical protein IH849_06080 [Acidobacteria bacterium]|nr:hypothetical protein [Acidobacteriota bacterium]